MFKSFKYITCFLCSYTSKKKERFAILKCTHIICYSCAVKSKGEEPKTIYCQFCKKSIPFRQLSNKFISNHDSFSIDKNMEDLKQKFMKLNDGTEQLDLLINKVAEEEYVDSLKEELTEIKELEKLYKQRSEVAKDLHAFRLKIRKQLLQKQYDEKKMTTASKMINN